MLHYLIMNKQDAMTEQEYKLGADYCMDFTLYDGSTLKLSRFSDDDDTYYYVNNASKAHYLPAGMTVAARYYLASQYSLQELPLTTLLQCKVCQGESGNDSRMQWVLDGCEIEAYTNSQNELDLIIQKEHFPISERVFSLYHALEGYRPVLAEIGETKINVDLFNISYGDMLAMLEDPLFVDIYECDIKKYHQSNTLAQEGTLLL